jgi:hypothetical protein
MSIDVTSIGSVGPSAAPPASRRAPHASSAPADTVETTDRIPAGPPPEVLDAIGRAASRHDELHAQGHRLAFETAPDGGVTVELQDLDGQLLRTLAPSEALDVATGGSLG